MTTDSFRCYLVTRDEHGEPQGELTHQPLDALPDGEVLVRVAWSSLNYKDALAASGNPGVARRLPHVPGIDAAGTVVRSQDERWTAGDHVVVTGYELGAGQWGGWADYIQVPSEWVVPLPAPMTLRECMLYGTAGFTAAQCVRELIDRRIQATDGEIVVTGATGGVGCLAVKLLATLGYQVVASTGKLAETEWLQGLGATRVIPRDEWIDDRNKPLLAARYAGGVDTVGGRTLETLLRSVQVGGCVAACGMVGGTDLGLTVYPFILRGVTLAGITSAWCPREPRLEIWKRLAGPWKLPGLSELATTVTLADLPTQVSRILHGAIKGRVIVQVGSS